MKFVVFTVMKIQIVVFWVVTPCSGVIRYHYFTGPCCLHLSSYPLALPLHVLLVATWSSTYLHSSTHPVWPWMKKTLALACTATWLWKGSPSKACPCFPAATWSSTLLHSSPAASVSILPHFLLACMDSTLPYTLFLFHSLFPIPFALLWMLGHHGPLKWWYPTTSHGFATQKTMTWVQNLMFSWQLNATKSSQMISCINTEWNDNVLEIVCISVIRIDVMDDTNWPKPVKGRAVGRSPALLFNLTVMSSSIVQSKQHWAE
jgi:hypothetical protein